MDYKYIEQLLERYWTADTSVEEERILRTFFSQENIPSEFAKYRNLFAYEQQNLDNDKLGDDFDERMLSLTEEAVQPAQRRTLTSRLMPLFKAAACVAIIVTLGNASQMAMQDTDGDEDINYSSYKDTFSDPSEAYNNVADALRLVSDGMSQAEKNDSANAMVTKDTDGLKNKQ